MSILKKKFTELQNRLLQEAKDFYQNKLISVVIFGSAGRETYRFDSDLDVLLIVNNLPRGRLNRIKQFMAIEEKLEPFLKELAQNGIHTYISPILKTPQEAETGSPLFLDMLEDAKILYDKDQFFAKILDQLRQKLAQLGSKRIWVGNAWYWVLKPDYQPGDIIEL